MEMMYSFKTTKESCAEKKFNGFVQWLKLCFYLYSFTTASRIDIHVPKRHKREKICAR